MALTADELAEARAIIALALDEDLRYGPDVTTLATVPADASATASIVARGPGVLVGTDIALMVLDEVLGEGEYRVEHREPDGTRLSAGGVALTVNATTPGLLTAERTMLNLVCHLSGIATTTAAWV
ncbi:MAG: nicotinate-nucleotide diphosphorylase (carboxylating), partial [Actinomycetia bacterium]|nr:nicotinate-nucleotide diphosphorylase (carboxylating) [Actinomycetes bacterium]